MDNFNYHSIRAKKARVGKILNNFGTRAVSIFVGLSFFAGFIYFVFLDKNSVG